MGQRLTVASADGTSLSVARSGSGTPLVLVHGMCGQPQDFALLQPLLVEHHQVWTYARRGRGGSGDTPPYSLQREVEDVHAVLAAVGQPSHLLGHSLGGALAALAAPDADLRSLILYEPALRQDRADPQARRRVDKLVEAGDLDGAIEGFAALAGISDDELAMIRSVPAALDGMKESSVTAPRESRALDALDPSSWRGRSIDVPAMLLSGQLTASAVYAGRDDLEPVLARGSFQTIPGQGHLATVFAATEFARRVLAFTAQVDG